MFSGESRQRILESMIVAVGRKGYRATTVGDAIAEAGASRATFYKHFGDKHDCFLAAYELVTERMLTAVEAYCDAERPWLERVRAGLASLIELLAAEPGGSLRQSATSPDCWRRAVPRRAAARWMAMAPPATACRRIPA
jgi:AcrR family transcriptional regulator